MKFELFLATFYQDLPSKKAQKTTNVTSKSLLLTILIRWLFLRLPLIKLHGRLKLYTIKTKAEKLAAGPGFNHISKSVII